MTPDDLVHLHTPLDPRVSPDGTRIAFVVSTPNLHDDRYDTIIWVSDDRSPTTFTSGPRDTAPRWSPDGSRLAFLRAGESGQPQATVIPIDGGEATTLTDFELGVEAIEWSSDGSRLVVVAITYSDEWVGLEDEERARRPRRITSVPYFFDNRGPVHDRKRHLWSIDPNGESEPSCLTPGDFNEEFPSWSPDGTTIAFISDREPGQGLVSGNDVWTVDVETGRLDRVTDRGFWTQVSHSPDGTLHLLGNTNSHYPVDSYLYRQERDGSLTCLTEHLDRSAVSLAAGPAAIRWLGGDAVVGHEDSGRFGLVRVAADGSTGTIVDDERIVLGFDAAAGVVAFTARGWESAGELHTIASCEETRLTALNTMDIGVVRPEHFTVVSDGHDLDVWVYLPEGGESVPLLLNIHGGPASQYGFGMFDEFQVYVGAGFGVVACNPRGSSGKGKAFVEAVKGEGWGTVDLADIRAAVTAALHRFPRLDASRMGVMGGSYGGFMTAWIIAREERWKAAIVERSLTSWTSFDGTSDIGGVFSANYLGVSHPEAWEILWEKSPLALAHQVKTPTLVIHSEEDYRTPIEQGEQYFMALLRAGTPTELMRFPGEGHEMSRSGKPRHRKERFEAILDWLTRHLL